MSQRNLDRNFKEALVRSGIQLRPVVSKKPKAKRVEQKEIEEAPAITSDLNFHRLRHTMLSWLGSTGANKPTIQAIAGHADVDVTDGYIVVDLAAKREAILRMEAAKLPWGSKKAKSEM